MMNVPYALVGAPRGVYLWIRLSFTTVRWWTKQVQQATKGW